MNFQRRQGSEVEVGESNRFSLINSIVCLYKPNNVLIDRKQKRYVSCKRRANMDNIAKFNLVQSFAWNDHDPNPR